jgi:hypothetical protein
LVSASESALALVSVSALESALESALVSVSALESALVLGLVPRRPV